MRSLQTQALLPGLGSQPITTGEVAQGKSLTLSTPVDKNRLILVEIL